MAVSAARLARNARKLLFPPTPARSAVDSKTTLRPSLLNDGCRLIDWSGVFVRRRKVELDWPCCGERRERPTRMETGMMRKAVLGRSMVRLLLRVICLSKRQHVVRRAAADQYQF